MVGHRRQSAFDRWWSGPKGAYLMESTDCSLLVARNVVSDEEIEAVLLTSDQTKDLSRPIFAGWRLGRL